MKRSSLVILIFILGLNSIACSESSKRKSDHSLQTVSAVEINRYLGVWYEIARFPFSVQKNCYATSATYELKPNGEISVLNQCHRDSIDGKISKAVGKAWIVDSDTNAKLKVSFNFFMGLFGGGDYWIIRLAPDYSHAVISEPKGRYLWILSRTRKMDEKLFAQIVNDLKSDGFQTEYLEKTPQPENDD